MSEADDLDGFVRDFDHPNFDSDFCDFDGKVEAAYQQHTRGQPFHDGVRPKTASHRRPLSAEATKKKSDFRSEYKPRVSSAVLEEVRNTLNPTNNQSGKLDSKSKACASAPLIGLHRHPVSAKALQTDFSTPLPAKAAPFDGGPNVTSLAKAGLSASGFGPTHAQPSTHSGVQFGLPSSASTLGATGKVRRLKSAQAYLREHRAKREEKEKKLEMDADQCSRELEYSQLYMMREVNEWCEALRDSTIYRAFKTDDGTLRCHVYKDGFFYHEVPAVPHEMSMNMFEKRYKTIRGRYSDAVLKGHIQGAQTKERTYLTEEEQHARQQEIREVLLQTMHLTTKLKEQLVMLDERSVHASPFIVE